MENPKTKANPTKTSTKENTEVKNDTNGKYRERLLETIDKTGKSRKELCDKLGFKSETTLTQMLYLKRKPSLRVAKILSELSGYRIEYIRCEDDKFKTNFQKEMYDKYSNDIEETNKEMKESFERAKRIHALSDIYPFPTTEMTFMFWLQFIEYMDRTIMESISKYYDIFRSDVYSLHLEKHSKISEKIPFDKFITKYMSINCGALNLAADDLFDTVSTFLEEIKKENDKEERNYESKKED